MNLARFAIAWTVVAAVGALNLALLVAWLLYTVIGGPRENTPGNLW